MVSDSKKECLNYSLICLIIKKFLPLITGKQLRRAYNQQQFSGIVLITEQSLIYYKISNIFQGNLLPNSYKSKWPQQPAINILYIQAADNTFF